MGIKSISFLASKTLKFTNTGIHLPTDAIDDDVTRGIFLYIELDSNNHNDITYFNANNKFKPICT